MSEQQVQEVHALPLQGKRVLVTRTQEQAGTFSARLKEVGAVPVEFPTIRVVPPQSWAPLDTALQKLCAGYEQQEQQGRADGAPAYDWLVFTSANGVKMCVERLYTLGYPVPALKQARIAAIGPATAATLARYGLAADLVPDEYIAEGVAAALLADAHARGESLAGKRILLARAAEARAILITELQAAGAQVQVVAAYATLPVSHDDERGRTVVRLLTSAELDIVTFTSSSTVHNFMRWLHSTAPELTQLLTDSAPRQRPRIASIGPITSRTAREYGLAVSIEAREFTIAGLVEALIQSTLDSSKEYV